MKRITSAILLAALLEPAAAHAARSDIGYPRMMQGPMLGAVTETTIGVWVRLSGPYECAVQYAQDESLENAAMTDPVTTSKERDYTAVIRMENLKPGTRYFYRVLVNGAPDPNAGKPVPCETAPPSGEPATFRVAFGSCARVQKDSVQPLWKNLPGAGADLFFWLGDNVYADTLDPDIIAEEYRRQREVAKLVPSLARIPQLAVWDDHDYGLNDHDRTNPIKEEALRVFKQYWPNPSYGLPDAPGVFFEFSYGGVDFFFTDCRYYRDPNQDPDTPDKTLLGEAQLEWLMNGLTTSEAPFKVIACGSGWSKAKGEGGDSWAAFLFERNRLFDFIRDNGISGVVLISGDTHVGELNAIPWSESGGYDFYDLVSSPLGQAPGSGWIDRRPEIRIRPVYANAENFGLMEFDMGDRPKLTFNLVDRYGNRPWRDFVIHADELVNGNPSWDDTITPDELKRLENQRSGEGYYKPLD